MEFNTWILWEQTEALTEADADAEEVFETELETAELEVTELVLADEVARELEADEVFETELETAELETTEEVVAGAQVRVAGAEEAETIFKVTAKYLVP